MLAVMVRSVVPVAVGVPEMRAVPLPLSVKVSPREACRLRATVRALAWARGFLPSR